MIRSYWHPNDLGILWGLHLQNQFPRVFINHWNLPFFNKAENISGGVKLLMAIRRLTHSPRHFPGGFFPHLRCLTGSSALSSSSSLFKRSTCACGILHRSRLTPREGREGRKDKKWFALKDSWLLTRKLMIFWGVPNFEDITKLYQQALKHI